MGIAHWLGAHWIGSEAAIGTPALTMTDQADGTGATATITGAAGTTNTVYYQAFTGLGTSTWTSGGSRTGNGTVDVVLATGHYLAYVKATNSAGAASVSTPVYFTVTDASNAKHYDILVGVQARIQSLSLSGVASASVLVYKIEAPRILELPGAAALPAVLITPAIERSNPREGVTTADTVVYGVRVMLLEKDNQEPTMTANLNRHLLWKEKIRRAFQNQALTGVAPVYTCAVEPSECVIPGAYIQGYMASTLLLRFSVRESRGI